MTELIIEMAWDVCFALGPCAPTWCTWSCSLSCWWWSTSSTTVTPMAAWLPTSWRSSCGWAAESLCWDFLQQSITLAGTERDSCSPSGQWPCSCPSSRSSASPGSPSKPNPFFFPSQERQILGTTRVNRYLLAEVGNLAEVCERTGVRKRRK